MSDDLESALRDLVRTALLTYDARHTIGCPQRQQNYWRLRGEYRQWAPDKPCTCGLDRWLGKHDDRAQG